MIVIDNFITISKYFFILNKYFRTGFGYTDIEFEYIDEKKDDRVLCHCNLCIILRNIVLFYTRRLKISKIK